jgi:adenosylcobinamide kinase/adenosylcobinamide-phosphate guanylyltransferase
MSTADPSPTASPKLTFILGGARGGKSAFALTLAERGQNVLFVATAEARDGDMSQRIERHRSERPGHWLTLEEPVRLAEGIQQTIDTHAVDTVIIDCVTLWVSNILLMVDADDATHRAEDEARARAEALLDVIATSSARWIVVSNEVGMGIVPSTKLGRDYRDLLGRVNQQIAAVADQVVFMIAGRALELRPLG